MGTNFIQRRLEMTYPINILTANSPIQANACGDCIHGPGSLTSGRSQAFGRATKSVCTNHATSNITRLETENLPVA